MNNKYKETSEVDNCRKYGRLLTKITPKFKYQKNLNLSIEIQVFTLNLILNFKSKAMEIN
jgi:hypothetical protein